MASASSCHVRPRARRATTICSVIAFLFMASSLHLGLLNVSCLVAESVLQ
jgi:hypothetical protein